MNANEKPELEIINQIRAKVVDPRNLNFETRLKIIAILRFEGMKHHEIGSLLRVTTRTIDRYVRDIKRRAVCLVKEISVDHVTGNLIRLADYCIQCALRKGDLALAWKIECEKTEKLQSLGYVRQRPIEIKGEFSHTFEQKYLETLPDKDLNDLCGRIIERRTDKSSQN